MSIKLGMFMMPFHHPDRDYAAILTEDQDAVILADRLGYAECYIGEHFSSWSERITSPLIFLASVAPRTRQIRLGTGVINLPQLHPATVAAHAATLRVAVYVACDPASFSRDCRVLLDEGWSLAALRAFDIFPMTEHVELVAAFEPPPGAVRS